jgi:hypothetical protein
LSSISPELDDSRGNPPLHAPDECVLEEARQPQIGLRSALRELPFQPDTQIAARDTGDGNWLDGSHMDAGRTTTLKRLTLCAAVIFAALGILWFFSPSISFNYAWLR